MMDHETKPMPARPWDELTDAEKAKTVCDHLAHEHASGNLRPISSEPGRGDGKPSTSKPRKTPSE